eukprot:288231-Chlamydomonas_euryale.AAC.2
MGLAWLGLAELGLAELGWARRHCNSPGLQTLVGMITGCLRMRAAPSYCAHTQTTVIRFECHAVRLVALSFETQRYRKPECDGSFPANHPRSDQPRFIIHKQHSEPPDCPDLKAYQP